MIPEKNIPELQVERFIDPTTGEANVHYLWKGSLLPKVRLTGKIADQISGLTLIQKDLKNAKRWMERASSLSSQTNSSTDQGASFIHATDRDLFDQAKAFFVAALTFYAKAYTEAAGRKAQMQRDWLDEPFRALHDYYIDFRHNFAAHSGDQKIEYADSFFLLVPESRKHVTLRLVTNRVQPDLAVDKAGDVKFIELIDHAVSKIEQRYFEAGKRMIEAAVSRPEAFWVAASHSTEPVDMDATINAVQKRKK